MSIPPDVAGQLPIGRWPATPPEVERRYAGPGSSDRRREIWNDWRILTTAVQEAVGVVPAAWISGSFVTSKPEPGDIDCVYVIDTEVLSSAREETKVAQFLDLVASSQVKAVIGLLVDSYVLPWNPMPGVSRASKETYLGTRGYWDDLWSRQRSADNRADAIISRGYLEVILDGYT